MVARFEKTPRSVMFSGQDWMFKKPTKTGNKGKIFSLLTYAFSIKQIKTFFTMTADIG